MKDCSENCSLDWGDMCHLYSWTEKKQKEKEVNSADEPVQWQIMEEKRREATEQRPVHNVQGDGYSIWYDLRKNKNKYLYITPEVLVLSA